MDLVLWNILPGVSLGAPLGPSGVAVIQNGPRRGFRRAFLAGLGVTLAGAASMLVVFLGESSLPSLEPVIVGVWLLGACAPAYLGLKSVLEARRAIDLETSVPVTGRNPVLVGFPVNVPNPIAVVWWVFLALRSPRARCRFPVLPHWRSVRPFW